MFSCTQEHFECMQFVLQVGDFFSSSFLLKIKRKFCRALFTNTLKGRGDASTSSTPSSSSSSPSPQTPEAPPEGSGKFNENVEKFHHGMASASASSSATNNEDNDVSIMGVRSPIMEQIINYAYLRQCKIDEKHVHELYAVADYCGIHGLMRICVDFMIKILTPENCISTMFFAK